MNKIEELEKKVESLEADIAVFKVILPPPQGFSSWEQFDNAANYAFENQS